MCTHVALYLHTHACTDLCIHAYIHTYTRKPAAPDACRHMTPHHACMY